MTAKNTQSLVARLRRQAETQSRIEIDTERAKIQTITCPNCGAGRAKQDGLTHCAYCGHEFTAHRLTTGIHLNQRDNTKK